MSGYWIFILYILPLLLAAGGFLVAYLHTRHNRHRPRPGE